MDVWMRSDVLFKLSGLQAKQNKALQTLHSFTDNVIQKRRETLARTSLLDENMTDDLGVKRKLAFLDILLQSNINGQFLSNLEIREEVDTFTFEGHDTTRFEQVGYLAYH